MGNPMPSRNASFSAKVADRVFDDLFEFNRFMKEAADVKEFVVSVYGVSVVVDLEAQSISVNGSPVEIGLPAKLENVRWICFRRTFAVFNTVTGQQKTARVLYGVGFQGNFKGRNYQRFVLVYPDGHWDVCMKR